MRDRPRKVVKVIPDVEKQQIEPSQKRNKLCIDIFGPDDLRCPGVTAAQVTQLTLVFTSDQVNLMGRSNERVNYNFAEVPGRRVLRVRGVPSYLHVVNL